MDKLSAEGGGIRLVHPRLNGLSLSSAFSFAGAKKARPFRPSSRGRLLLSPFFCSRFFLTLRGKVAKASRRSFILTPPLFRFRLLRIWAAHGVSSSSRRRLSLSPPKSPLPPTFQRSQTPRDARTERKIEKNPHLFAFIQKNPNLKFFAFPPSLPSKKPPFQTASRQENISVYLQKKWFI